MAITNEDVLDFFKNRNRDDYQRDNFDNFLNKIGFNYNVPSIHIAGTNGKGSTASYIASIYTNEGYKVGLFTSPCINEIREMLSINGNSISNESILTYLGKYKKEFDKYQLSPFEIETFIAFQYFMDEKCDIAIIECGMGGEIDATNVFEPILSIITSISLEHTSYLGKSLSEIALNKGGIIAKNVPTLIGLLPEEAKDTITSIAKEKESFVVQVSDYHNDHFIDNGISFGYLERNDLFIPTKAKYSLIDACLAIDAINILKDRFSVKVESIKNGLNECVIPNRFEKLCENPTIFVDGSHNPEAIYQLCDSFFNAYPTRKFHIVFCCFKDKNIERMLASLGELTNDIVLTTFDHIRARDEFDYFLYADEYRYVSDCVKAVSDFLVNYPQDITLVTGSFAFAGYIRKMFLEGKIPYEIAKNE